MRSGTCGDTVKSLEVPQFGAEMFRPSPRQADLMIVSGTITLKMGQVIQRVWQQMSENHHWE